LRGGQTSAGAKRAWLATNAEQTILELGWLALIDVHLSEMSELCCIDKVASDNKLMTVPPRTGLGATQRWQILTSSVCSGTLSCHYNYANACAYYVSMT